MYLALYRKFRPTSFEEVVGQDHIVRTLKNQIQNNQIGHAYLFCGSRGTGKTSVAKIFAKAVNCQNPKNGSPCMECEACKNLALSNNMDIIEIDAASNNRVDEIRDLRDKVKYAPLNGRFKVYIIDEVHMLTDSAFNALLKTLEEPPKHIIFILATTEPQKLPATILSRVLRFDFRLVDQNTLKNLLSNIFAKSGIMAEDDALMQIAKAGNGSVRDCLSVADMCASYANGKIKQQDVLEVLGASDTKILQKLCFEVLSGNISEFLSVLNSEAKSGKNLTALANDMTKMFRNMLVLKSGSASNGLVLLDDETKQNLLEIVKNVSLKTLNFALQSFSKTEQELKFASFPQLLLETTAIDVCLNQNQTGSEPLMQTPKTQEVAPTPRKIWGQVLLLMSKDNDVLHAMCVEITHTNIEQNNFLIEATNSIISEMLKKSENYAYLVACFKKLGYNYNIKIINQVSEEKPDTAKLLSEKLGLSINKKQN